MLTEKDLDEFAEYMKSGAMEQDFKDGCENDRFYLLNLLEKFMDVAELADETATKLIFRGSLGALFPEKKPEEEGDKEDFFGDFFGRGDQGRSQRQWG